MMTKEEIMKVLDAMNYAISPSGTFWVKKHNEAKQILQAALAEPSEPAPSTSLTQLLLSAFLDEAKKAGITHLSSQPSKPEPSEPVQDLVERLRLGDGSSPDHALLLEAANAIEHLLVELNKRLKQEEQLQNRLFKEINK